MENVEFVVFLVGKETLTDINTCSIINKLDEMNLPGLKIIQPSDDLDENKKLGKDSDLMLAVYNQNDDMVAYHIAFCYAAGVPVCLLSESAINETIKSSIVCNISVSTEQAKANDIFEKFILDAYSAKVEIMKDVHHIQNLQNELHEDASHHKAVVEKFNKDNADKMKEFQAKDKLIQEASEECFKRSQQRVESLSKYKDLV